MSRWGRLVVENHRGKPVPRTLGILLAGGATVSAVIVVAVTGARPAGSAGAASLMLIFGVGLLDDLVPGGPRGLRAHLRALSEGRITTGVLKVVVITACSIVTVGLLGLGVVASVSGVALLAGCANLGNALDVRPGRALKVFAPILLIGVALAPMALHPALPGLALCSLPALRRDLAERDMLGDGGANLLGFAGGLVLLLSLPEAVVPLAALAAVGLNLLADTVGLSTVIARSRFLSALDRLGRVP